MNVCRTCFTVVSLWSQRHYYFNRSWVFCIERQSIRKFASFYLFQKKGPVCFCIISFTFLVFMIWLVLITVWCLVPNRCAANCIYVFHLHWWVLAVSNKTLWCCVSCLPYCTQRWMFSMINWQHNRHSSVGLRWQHCDGQCAVVQFF